MFKRVSSTYVILLFIVVVGLIARLWAINYGLPNIYHMEEPFYTAAAQGLACDANFDSSLLQLHTYLFAATIKATNIMGQPSCVDVLQGNESIVLVGRLISVLLGTLTIGVVFQLGKMLYSAPVGLMGALFIALDFLHVRESQHGTPDVATVFLIALALLSYIRISKPNASRWHFFLAGILTVLCINGRLTNVVLMLPFVCAYLAGCNLSWRSSWREWLRAIVDRNVSLTALVMFFTFILVNPQIWSNPIEYLRYWKNFFTLSQQGGFGSIIVDALPAPLYYLSSIGWASGLLLGIAFVLGMIWAVRQHKLADVLLLGFIVPYFLVAAISKVYFARYIIPILPFLGILAGRFLWDVIQPAPQRKWLLSAASIILVIQPVTSIGRYAYIQSQVDTRTLSAAWISSNIPQGAKIAVEWHSPTIDSSKYDVTVVDFYGLSLIPFEKYQSEGYQYLITSSFISDNTFISPEVQARKIAFYAELAAKGDLLMEFKPYSGDVAPPYNIDQVLGPITSMDQFDRPGPSIQIYRIPPASG